MGMSGSSGGDPGGYSTLAEINVTPMVDVMLVLLTIFMVASSVETIQVKAEREKLLKERKMDDDRLMSMARLDRQEDKEKEEVIDRTRDRNRMSRMLDQQDRVKEMEEELLDRSQNVPIDLPKATSEAVNLGEQKKIVVTFTKDREFYIGDTLVISCGSEEFAKLAKEPGGNPAWAPLSVEDRAFRHCLAAIKTKMVNNIKLQEDKECYLRADRLLDYGDVLSLMATIRHAGITKFGLIAEELEALEEGD